MEYTKEYFSFKSHIGTKVKWGEAIFGGPPNKYLQI